MTNDNHEGHEEIKRTQKFFSNLVPFVIFVLFVNFVVNALLRDVGSWTLTLR